MDERKISFNTFQKCSHCKGSVTEAFLDAVLESKFPQILHAFKVPLHLRLVCLRLIYVCLGVDFQQLLHSALFGRQSVCSLLLRCNSCCPQRTFRNRLFKLLQSINCRKHENGRVTQPVATASESENRRLPALVAVLGRWLLRPLFYDAIQSLVTSLAWHFPAGQPRVIVAAARACAVDIRSLFSRSPVCHTFTTRCACIEKVGKITCDGMDRCPYEACDHMVSTGAAQTAAHSCLRTLRLSF